MSSVNGPVISDSDLSDLSRVSSNDNEEPEVDKSDTLGEKLDKIQTENLNCVKNENMKEISEYFFSEENEEEWLDIIGSGDFKKRVIKSGNGIESRPKQGNSIFINYKCYKDDSLLANVENTEIVIGDLDIIPAFDLFLPLMEEGEIAEVLVPSRLAYGKIGRQPDIPSDCPLRYEVELIKIKEPEEKWTAAHAMELSEKKKEKGNFWYGRGDYVNALACYKRATEILDIKWDDDVDSALSQTIVESRIKVYNNMAAVQIKLEAYDQALKSLDFVLRLQPKNVKAHFRKGKILSAKGLTSEAISEMKKASELEPETKVIQQELVKLLKKKKAEDRIQRAMYKRMFPSGPPKPPTSKIKKWLKHGTVMAGSCVAFAIGIAAYRQYFS